MILKDEINNSIVVTRYNRAVPSSKSNNAMTSKMKLEVLLKVIKRIYDKIQGMQEMIDASMIEVCAEESLSPEHVFLFCYYLYHNGYLRKKN